MADTAFQTKYRMEFIAGFEQRQAYLRGTVTTEANVNGNQAVFLVADSNGETAVTRGANGLIPAKADNLTQNTATLVEWHDLRRKTRFNIYAGQSDQRRIMQMNSMGVINRKIDSDIITALETGTQDTSTAVRMSLDLAMHAYTILGNNAVEMDGNIFCAITPAAFAYLIQTKEFASVDYVNTKPFANIARAFSWAGINWIVHPNLSGKGTSAEKCIMYHRSAIGHAIDTTNMNIAVGYDEEQDYSFARTSCFMGSKLLQNSGVVIINHDGSGYAAS
jgi:hypothetical protein